MMHLLGNVSCFRQNEVHLLHSYDYFFAGSFLQLFVISKWPYHESKNFIKPRFDGHQKFSIANTTPKSGSSKSKNCTKSFKITCKQVWKGQSFNKKYCHYYSFFVRIKVTVGYLQRYNPPPTYLPTDQKMFFDFA